MKTIITALLLVSFLIVPFYHPTIFAKTNRFYIHNETKVYICLGGTAYAYHSRKDCIGLDNCTHAIKQTTLDSAINYYKRSRVRSASNKTHAG